MTSRKTLAQIQERIISKDDLLSTKKSIIIYEDNPSSKENLFTNKKKVSSQCCSFTIGCQTDILPCYCDCHTITIEKDLVESKDEGYLLMTQEETSSEYWKILAERRREALNDSLRENEELHNQICLLKEENKQLSELAENADYFASILKELTDGDANDSGIQGESQLESKEYEDLVKDTK